MSSFAIIIYCSVRPHSSRSKRRIEVFNEMMLLIASYHLFIFSGFAHDQEAQFLVGFSFTAIIILTLFVNMGRMFRNAASRMVWCRKRKTRVIPRRAKSVQIVEQEEDDVPI